MRFCLSSMAAPGTDIVLSEDRLAGARNFANIIWNAARFLFMNLDKFEQGGTSLEELVAPEVRGKAPYAASDGVPLIDQWLYSRLAATIETVNSALENYRFHEAAQNVYQFFWGDFCDWYIEWVKPDLLHVDRTRAIVAWRNLFAAFDAALRLLHPFMPFLTEELWHQLPQPAGRKSIALGRFPESRAGWENAAAGKEFAVLQDVINALRNLRPEVTPDSKKKIAAEFFSGRNETRTLLEANRETILRLATLSAFKISGEALPQTGGAIRSTAQFDVRIPYAESVDVAGEKTRIQKEIERLEKDIAGKEQQLGNE